MVVVASQLIIPPSANQSQEAPSLEAVAEEFLAQVVDASAGDYEYPLPSAIDSVPADLFGGELGDYELNEIPSLFNLDSHQMSADLENLGLAAAVAASASISFVTKSEISSGSSEDSGPDDAANSATNSKIQEESSVSKPLDSKKRSSAIISEDEDCSFSSSPSLPPKTKKTRRVPRNASVTTSLPTEPSEALSTSTKERKLLALKPLAPRRVVSTMTSSPSDSSLTADHGSVTSLGGRTINTSTAHVKALTGAKGAVMCFESVSGTNLDTTIAIPNVASADLTPEEKARFSRDRNRLHAKNTRIRKKAYVDELKMTLDVLVKERDIAMVAKNRKEQIEIEERNVRYSVVEEFLKLRGRNERSLARWSAILEETVTLHLPYLDWNTKGCKASVVDVEGPSKKIVSGVTELMNECNEFSKQLEKGSKSASVGLLSFQCDRDSLLMEGADVVIDWTASSADASKPMAIRGTCRASFNPQSNKLHSVELFFDSSPLLDRIM